MLAHGAVLVGLGEIVAGREVLAFSRQDDDADVVVVGGPVEGVVQLIEQLGVLGVGAVGPVQPDARDMRLGHLVDQRFEGFGGHVFFLSRIVGWKSNGSLLLYKKLLLPFVAPSLGSLFSPLFSFFLPANLQIGLQAITLYGMTGSSPIIANSSRSARIPLCKEPS